MEVADQSPHKKSDLPCEAKEPLCNGGPKEEHLSTDPVVNGNSCDDRSRTPSVDGGGDPESPLDDSNQSSDQTGNGKHPVNGDCDVHPQPGDGMSKEDNPESSKDAEDTQGDRDEKMDISEAEDAKSDMNKGREKEDDAVDKMDKESAVTEEESNTNNLDKSSSSTPTKSKDVEKDIGDDDSVTVVEIIDSDKERKPTPEKVDSKVETTRDNEKASTSNADKVEATQDKAADKSKAKKLKGKGKDGDSAGSEGLRPLAKLLFDIGVDLARQQVYTDLIRVQTKKKKQNKLQEKDCQQLDKLNDACQHLAQKNKPFKVKALASKCHCGYRGDLANIMEAHKEYGHEEAPFKIRCGYCETVSLYPDEHFSHCRKEHNRSGRMFSKLATFVCPFCPYEGNQRKTAEKHMEKCEKNFRLSRNLQPTPADCDIPLRGMPPKPPAPTTPVMPPRPAAPQPPPLQKRPELHPQMQAKSGVIQRPPVPIAVPRLAGTGGNQVVQVGDQLYAVVYQEGQPFLTPLAAAVQAGLVPPGRNQVTPPTQAPTAASTNSRVAKKPVTRDPKPDASKKKPEAESGGFEICEICGGFVKDKDSLRIHFFWAHKIEIHPAVIQDKSRCLKCQTCGQLFWTYQGLMRHANLVHDQRRLTATAATCYVCAQPKIGDFISHMTLKHPMVVKALLAQNRCIVCQMAFASESLLEQHILSMHKGVVNHYSAVDNSTSPGQSNAKGSKNNSPIPTGVFQNTSAKGKATPSPGGSSTKKREKFYCRCGKVFATKQELDGHHATAHAMKCTRCKASFDDRVGLQIHFNEKHSKEKEQCQLCSEIVCIGRPMFRHLKRTHVKKSAVVVPKLRKAKYEKYIQEYREWVESKLSSDDASGNISPKSAKGQGVKRKLHDSLDAETDDIVVIDLDRKRRPPKRQKIFRSQKRHDEVRTKKGSSPSEVESHKKNTKAENASPDKTANGNDQSQENNENAPSSTDQEETQTVKQICDEKE